MNSRVTIFGMDGAILREETSENGRPAELAYDSRGRLHLNRRITEGTQGVPTVSILSGDGPTTPRYGNFRVADNPIERANQNVLRLSPAPNGGMWILHSYRAFVERYDSTGSLIRRFSLPLQEGQDTVGPVIVQDPKDPDRIRIRRIAIADDIVMLGDSLVLVAMTVRPDSGAIHTRILAFDTTGTVRSRMDLPNRANRLAIHQGRLVTLTFQLQDPARIDVYRISGTASR